MPVWKPMALADRRRIAEHIGKVSPQAAVELVDLLLAKAGHLDAHPKIGRPGRIRGTGEWVAHPDYVLVYRLLAGDQVEILRVLSAWPSSKIGGG